MANAEGQSKTIALVIFILAFIAAGATTYYCFDNIEPAEQRANEAKNREKSAADELARAQNNYRELRRKIVGEENIEDHATAIEIIDSQRQVPAIAEVRRDGTAPWPGEPGYDAKQTYQHYQDALNYLHSSLEQNDQRIADLEREKRDLETTVNEIKDNYARQYAEAREAQASNTAMLSQETTTLLAELKTKEQNLDTTIERYNDLQQQLYAARKRREEQEERLTQVQEGLDQILEDKIFMAQLRERLRYDGRDGSIVRVNKDGKSAEIDIGKADSLRTGVVFGVFGRDSGGNAHELPKAFMEIRQILGPHRATARISGEVRGTPVVPGDILSSPLWSRGDQEGVAYVGIVNLDEDGNHDNETFRQIVEESGGKIDAELNLRTLKSRGEITIKTGWLVIGDTPDPETATTPKEREVFEAIKAAEQKFREQAADHGVRIASVRNFMNYLSYNVPNGEGIPMVNRANDIGNIPARAQFSGRNIPARP